MLRIAEELKAKAAGKNPGYYYGSITLSRGKKEFAIYREGKVIDRYSVSKREFGTSA
jgi:hypothetical protein